MISIIQGLKGLIIIGLSALSLNVFASENSNSFIKKIMKEIRQEDKYHAKMVKRVQAEVAEICEKIRKEVKQEFQEAKKRRDEQEKEDKIAAEIAQAAQVQKQAEQDAKLQARTVTTQEMEIIRAWVIKKHSKKIKNR